MAEALRIITSRDGIKGLRRGMLPRVLTVAPSTAISWMSYEFFSEYLHVCLRVRTVRTVRYGEMWALTPRRSTHPARWCAARDGTAGLSWRGGVENGRDVLDRTTVDASVVAGSRH